MRWIAVALMLTALAIAGAVGWRVANRSVEEAHAPMSQDYRASLLALQTGWMSFGQLWFVGGR